MTVSAAPRSGRFPSLAKYDVLEELGHGGMATVYRAHDRRLARDVAVKVIHPHLRDSREVAHRFAVEAQAVAKLRHPNIVEVFDVSSEDEPEQYLVVELLRGLTLRKLLQVNGALPPEVAAAIGAELLSALAHAHGAGVVHRDIKPENVMIEHHSAIGVSTSQESPHESGVGRASPGEQPGDRALVKLTDFGIAKLLDGHGMTSTGQVLGSPAHMAPEQIEGGEVNGRADVFGIGVLLYECMVGHLPFEGNNPAQVLRRVLDGVYPSAEQECPMVGKTWSQILDRALARKQEDRFPDATSMRDALVGELKRLKVASPRSELEAWCDAPSEYAVHHTKRMITSLCDLASAARRRGDALAAAADYNRALAYAPHDPALLKIVSGIQRSESNRRVIRKVAPIVAGAAAMGVLAFFVTRAFHSRPQAELTARTETVTAPAASTAQPAPVVVADTAGPASTKPVVSGPAPTTAKTTVLAPPKIVAREVKLRAVHPSHGVLLAIDGDEPFEVEEGRILALDSRAHVLLFNCKRDMENLPVCDPKQVSIPAGASADPIDVRLQIKDAILRVEGDPKNTYGIREYPRLRLAVGDDTMVPLTESAVLVVQVVERETDHKPESVRLHAGKRVTVTFLPQ